MVQTGAGQQGALQQQHYHYGDGEEGEETAMLWSHDASSRNDDRLCQSCSEPQPSSAFDPSSPDVCRSCRRRERTSSSEFSDDDSDDDNAIVLRPPFHQATSTGPIRTPGKLRCYTRMSFSLGALASHAVTISLLFRYVWLSKEADYHEVLVSEQGRCTWPDASINSLPSDPKQSRCISNTVSCGEKCEVTLWFAEVDVAFASTADDPSESIVEPVVGGQPCKYLANNGRHFGSSKTRCETMLADYVHTRGLFDFFANANQTRATDQITYPCWRFDRSGVTSDAPYADDPGGAVCGVTDLGVGAKEAAWDAFLEAQISILVFGAVMVVTFIASYFFLFDENDPKAVVFLCGIMQPFVAMVGLMYVPFWLVYGAFSLVLAGLKWMHNHCCPTSFSCGASERWWNDYAKPFTCKHGDHPCCDKSATAVMVPAPPSPARADQPPCVNATNPFHECTPACLLKVPGNSGMTLGNDNEALHEGPCLNARNSSHKCTPACRRISGGDRGEGDDDDWSAA